MDYVLLGVLLLTLALVIMSIWFSGHDTRFIYGKLKKNREADQVKQAQVENLAREILKANQSVSDYQFTLSEKMNELTRLMGAHHIYVEFQQQQFTTQAQSDMLSARRDELIRTKELKVALERIISMTTMSRQEPSAIDQLAIESLTNRINELEKILENNFEGGM